MLAHFFESGWTFGLQMKVNKADGACYIKMTQISQSQYFLKRSGKAQSLGRCYMNYML